VRQTLDPTVTVLMPVRNGEKFVHSAIQSILDQTFYDFEFIVINDGSEDRTLEILSGYARVDERLIVIEDCKDTGIANCLNLGLSLARGCYIARMDADDISRKNRLRLQVDRFGQDQDLVLCGTNAVYFAENRRLLRATNFPLADRDIRMVGLFENPFAHPTVMIRKDTVSAIGGYDPTYDTSQDYELWVRMLDEGRVANLPECLVEIRRHPHSVSSQRKERQRENTAVIQTNYVNLSLRLNNWPVENAECIGRNLFLSKKSDLGATSDCKEAMRHALSLLRRFEELYPYDCNNTLQGYVYGRCLIAVFCEFFYYRTLGGIRLLTKEGFASVSLGFAWLVKSFFKQIVKIRWT
jgi:glycosyltransferase involved in cell wall biosynthesis